MSCQIYMKKLFSYFLIILLLFSLTACTNQEGIPDGMSEETYSLAKQVLSITNDLLNDTIDSKEAYSQIKTLYKQIEKKTADASGNTYDSLVKLAVESILSNIKSMNSDTNISSDAISASKDLLEKYLGTQSN